MNKILKEDIESFQLPNSLTSKLKDTTIAVTGATGLIGSIFVRCLQSLDLNIRFVLPVRNTHKAEGIFKDNKSGIRIVETDISEYFNTTEEPIDYIIHCASPTNGQFMTDHPVETIELAIDSTKSILQFARRSNSIKGIVYVSSIEYYGEIDSDNKVDERTTGYIDHKSPRSSYSLGKQTAEFLSYSYATEYDVPVKIARLTQTFGAGISHDDNRVFAQFARSVISGENIVLHTSGRSSKPYCYTTDCVRALVYILLLGEKGEAYNVAARGSYISIIDLAKMYRDEFNQGIKVVIDETKNKGYAPVTKVNLDPSKLESLGWEPLYGLGEMLNRLILSLKEDIYH